MKTIPSTRLRSHTLRLAASILVIAAASGSLSHAAVSIVSNVNLSGGIYTYSYTVNNTGTAADLAFVEIPIGQSVLVSNATAPTGFGIIADGAPSNFVTLFEDIDPSTPQTFAPNSSVGVFSYQSADAPGIVSFSATDANGDTFTGFTQSAVPEPSGLLLFAASAVPLLAARRRRTC